jgi:hypothetical protein
MVDSTVADQSTVKTVVRKGARAETGASVCAASAVAATLLSFTIMVQKPPPGVKRPQRLSLPISDCGLESVSKNHSGLANRLTKSMRDAA